MTISKVSFPSSSKIIRYSRETRFAHHLESAT